MGNHIALAKARQARARERELLAAQAKWHLPKRRCALHHTPPASLLDELASDQRLQHGKEQMLANGRCYHQVNHLSKVYDLETFLCLPTMTRSSQRLADHGRCVNWPACVAYDTDDATYNVTHVCKENNCDMISTPHSPLVKIIRRGGIPLISIERDTETTATPTLRVHARAGGSKYIAISHVW